MLCKFGTIGANKHGLYEGKLLSVIYVLVTTGFVGCILIVVVATQAVNNGKGVWLRTVAKCLDDFEWHSGCN